MPASTRSIAQAEERRTAANQRPGIEHIRIVYLAPADIQVARVDRQAIVYFCAALARLGVDVELVTLGIKLSNAELHRPADPLSLYRLDTRFPVEVVRTRLHQDSQGWLTSLTRLQVHARAAWKRSPRQKNVSLFFYTKNYAPALALMAMRLVRPGFRIAFEVHVPPTNALKKFVLRRADAVIANSYALADELRATLGLRDSRLIGLHQGVDLESYLEDVDRKDLRSSLALPLDRPLAIYTGKIFRGYREVEYILEAAADPSVSDVLFVLVGGREDHLDDFRRDLARNGPTNVLLTGFVPPLNVHQYQRAADVLLLYYPSGINLNAYRSPGKLFEYMASGVPIVAVHLPVLAEVLGNPPAALLVRPDSPSDLAAAVRHVLDNPEESAVAAATAQARVRDFTWDNRAVRLVEFLCPRRAG
jgi:glycosyltransferase involved in cell wall biosynthesis